MNDFDLLKITNTSIYIYGDCWELVYACPETTLPKDDYILELAKQKPGIKVYHDGHSAIYTNKRVYVIDQIELHASLHDIKNHLNIIIGYCQLSDDTMPKEWVSVIYNSASKISNIIDSLRN